MILYGTKIESDKSTVELGIHLEFFWEVRGESIHSAGCLSNLWKETNASDLIQRVGGWSGSKYLKLVVTYRTVSEGSCERESGIEPVKLLCDRSLQTYTYGPWYVWHFFFALIHYNLQGWNGSKKTTRTNFLWPWDLQKKTIYRRPRHWRIYCCKTSDNSV
jgi:hypothetical protein